MTYKDIIKLLPTIQASQLAGANLKTVKKKKIKTKDMINLGTTNIVGISLLQTESQLIDL